MKRNLKNFPCLQCKAEGVEPNSGECQENLDGMCLDSILKWRDAFEAELRKRLKLNEKDAKNCDPHSEALIEGQNLLLIELLGESAPYTTSEK